MKNLLNSAVFAILLAAPMTASAGQGGAIARVLRVTDPVLSDAFRQAQEGMPIFTVPAPVSISPNDERTSDTPAADYLPLNKRVVYEYEYTSSEFLGAKVIRVEFLGYSEAEKSAAVNMIIFNKNKPKVSNFVIAAGPTGIRSSDSPIYGPRLEIPFPLAYNQTWHEGSDRNRVAALNAKVTVPAGVYSGCLKITTRLNGGEAGSAERYYAPGVGLVYEQLISEDRQDTIKLTAYQLK
ncbi:MAG: hypothetical protein A2X31_07730 [Elusimicrobia bacterium GWB2_63_22]|nr:MAG: hypothetical protein A2X31_07730 [Elusimicrobia bacterium GWB2_63_22]